MSDAVMLLAGLALAGVGGELFVRGAVGLAAWARVLAGIIGATVAAFATSSPELSVSVTAAAEGRPQIALGDALGSNVTNVGLVLGLAALIAAVRVPRDAGVRDVPVVLLAPLGTALLAADGRISRVDGALLLAAFTAWLLAVMRRARHERSAAAGTLGEPGGGRRAARAAAAGLVCLVVAGLLIVDAAAAIGVALGMDAFVVGATLVAVGTSAAGAGHDALMAKLRGDDGVGLGTLLGATSSTACASLASPA